MRLGLLLCLVAGGAGSIAAQDSTEVSREEEPEFRRRSGERWRVRIPRLEVERLHRLRDRQLDWPRELGRIHWRHDSQDWPRWRSDRVRARVSERLERAREQAHWQRDLLRDQLRWRRDELRDEVRARREAHRHLLRERAQLQRDRWRDWSWRRSESMRRYRAI